MNKKYNILLLFITLIIVFVGAELFARAYYVGLQNVFISFLNVKVNHLVKRADNCEITFDLKPNLNAYGGMKKFVTNSHGFRDKEYSYEKPPGTYRIAVVGDSFTVPWALNIEEAWHSILEERFNAEDRKVEILNFAVAGYGPEHYLANLKFKGLKYGIDAAIVGFYCGNDLYHQLLAITEENKDNITLINGEVTMPPLFVCDYEPPKSSRFKSYFLRLIRESKLCKKIKKVFSREETVQEKETLYTLIKYDKEKILDDINNFSKFSSEYKLPIVFFLIPEVGWNTTHNNMHPFMLQLLCDSGFQVIDGLPPLFQEAYKNAKKPVVYPSDLNIEQFRVFPRDGHTGKEANKIFAEVIYKKLKEYRDSPENQYQICIEQLNYYYIDEENRNVKVKILTDENESMLMPLLNYPWGLF